MFSSCKFIFIVAYSIFFRLNLTRALPGLKPFMVIKSLFKMIKNAFYFTWKALFVLVIFKFLFWIFGHIGKRLHRKILKLWRHKPDKEQLQYRYCQISQEVKSIRQWNFDNVTWEIFFLKNHKMWWWN